MKVYQGIEEFKKLQRAVITTGTFDGVHLGHRTIIKRLKEVAHKINGESVVLTFYPHPRMVLEKNSKLKLINTIAEKTKLLEETGIDHLIIHPFTKAFSHTTALEYVRDILVDKIGIKKLVIGYDHHFGKNREGSLENLQKYAPTYGFEVEEIPAQDIDNVKISSTKIRKALEMGNVEGANEFLGYPFQLGGKVVHGNKLGRKLGFPTANIKIESDYKLLPAEGIYAVEVIRNGEKQKGMLNIGRRPTVDKINAPISIEVNLFDFQENLYDENIQLNLIAYIRKEVKFENKEALVSEMKKDELKCRSIFKI